MTLTYVVAAVLLLGATLLVEAESESGWELNIFYINDIKYDIFPVNGDVNSTTPTEDCVNDPANANTCFGGLSRLKSLVDSQIKPSTKSNDSTHIWLNAGHTLSSRDENVYEVLKFDAGALMRNLSFDALALEPAVYKYGLEASQIYTGQLRDVVLAANVPQLSKSKLIPIGGSCHVAVIGFVDKAVVDEMEVYNVEAEEEYKAIEDEIKAVQTAHKDKKIWFVALGSSNVDTATELAKISDLDLVIFSGGNFTDDDPAGNSTDKLNYFESVTNGNKKTYIASIKKNWTTFDQRFLVGRITLSLTDTCQLNTTVLPVQQAIEYQDTAESSHQDFNKYIQSEFHKLAHMNEVVAKTKVNLLPTKLQCRLGECALGNMMADAMVEQLNNLTPDVAWPMSVKMAVFPAYLIANRNTMNVTGDVTPRIVYNLLGQDEYVYTVALNGKLLKKMFELAIGSKKKKNDQMDNFLQVSEYLRVQYDFDHRTVFSIKTLSQVPGSQDVAFKDVDLNDNTINYTVAVPFSMLYDSDTYDFLRTTLVTFYPATVSDALTHHVTRPDGGYVAVPSVGTRVTRNNHVDEYCVSHTGETVILTIVILVVIAIAATVLWKYIWPRYRMRRDSLTHLL